MKKKILLFTFIVLLLVIIFLGYSYFIKNNQSIPINSTSENIVFTDVFEETSLENSLNKIVVELPTKEDSHVKIAVIGDIMCHNSQYIDAKTENSYDFSYVFDDIRDKISSADIAIGNLETTFAGAARGYSNYPQFNTPEQLARNLKDFGIDILTTANNHCMDTGYSGLESTLNYLDEAGISHVGTNRSYEEQNTILIQEINDIKIAFLSFTYGTNSISIPLDKPYAVNLIDEELIKSQIELAKAQKPDIICASMHWGIEYETQQNATQENLANFLFENGVDIILGSHPHVLQPMEKRSVVLENGDTKDCFVIYSLGNFMSGQTKKNTRTSIILNIELDKDGYTGKTTIGNISYTPIYTYKSASTIKKYKVLDIPKAIFNYESGIDTSIVQNNYTILKNEIERVSKMYEGFEMN